MRLIHLSLLGLLAATAAPRILPNDSWTFQDTVENKSGWHQTRSETTVEHAGATGIALSVKETGSTMPPNEQLAGSDWSRSRSRSRSVNGQQTVVNRPLAFPLTIGKRWTVEYSEDHPNHRVNNERRKTVYKVTGWEDVTVPAGSFRALKIEADGNWTIISAPAVSAMAGSRVDAQGATTVMQTGRTTPATTSGRTCKAFWYVPAVKKCVKSVEQYYDTNGVRNERFTAELLSAQVAD